MIEVVPCVAAPDQVYVLAELFLIGVAMFVSAAVSAGVVWWRMTGTKEWRG